MPLDLSIVANAPDLSSSFTVLRSVNGAYSYGEFIDSKQPIQLYGPVSIASPRDLDQIPEGDRAQGAMVFWCSQEVYAARNPNGSSPQNSDILQWNGIQYRVTQVSQRPMNGFWRAVAFRMQGT